MLVAGCATASLSSGPLVLPDGGDDRALAREIAARAQGAEVVYLGEQHDNPLHHARQRLILEAMAERGPAPAVGFEMLAHTRQADVEAALARAPGREDLEGALRWRASGWPDFAMYWPLFELALRDRLPVLALDLDASLARRIAREGLGALGEAAPQLRSLLPPDAAREADIARTIRDAHCGLVPEERTWPMVEAWHARNVTMARLIAAALDRGRRVAVIVGRGHQAEGGLPAQLAELRPGTRQFIVDLVEARAGTGADAARERSTADVVWLGPPLERPDRCATLRRRAGLTPVQGEGGRDVITSGVDRGGAPAGEGT